MKEEVFHLATLLGQKAKKYGNRAALYYRDNLSKQWLPVSWNEFNETADILASALIEKQIKPTDKIGLFSQNMVETIIADFANFAAKAVSIPMYATSTADQIAFMVDDAKISIIYAGEQYQYDVACEVLKTSKYLKTIVAVDDSIDLKGVKQAIRYKDFVEFGKAHPHTEEIAALKATASDSDLVNILYTSGTTGQPKGVTLHQFNYSSAIRQHNKRLPLLNDKDTVMCFLPLTHVLERGWSYLVLQMGMTLYINRDPRVIADTMPEVRPNAMCAVPRYWEKVYAAIWDKINHSPAIARKLFKYALKLGYKRNLEYHRYGKHSPMNIGIPYKFIAKPLFNKVKKAAGIDRGKFFPTAGARLSDEINEFLHALDIPICIGYGLTESTASVSFYDPDMKNYCINSVGKIMPELQVKIADNGEILLKGDTITAGYYQRPDANKEAFTEDGFFKTGDAGYIDMEGNLHLTDRIKDLFKTAGGKYIAPQMLEALIGEDSLVDQCVAIGNERKYVSMLIVPDFELLEKWAKEQSLKWSTREELVALPEVKAQYQSIIDKYNVDLARYEQIKYFTLLPKAFSMEQGHLTNTLKIKRKVVAELFAKEIDAMYPKD